MNDFKSVIISYPYELQVNENLVEGHIGHFL